MVASCSGTRPPYQYLKRQSQADAGQWVDLVDPRTTFVATK
jgi:predicted transglutaminase-like cysteine proteinase